MKHLYLHVGFEKTGTTALQDFWSNNNEILSKYDIHYPVIGREIWSFSNMRRTGHHYLVQSIMQENKRRDKEIISFNKFYQLFRREINHTPSKKILISSESFRPVLSNITGQDRGVESEDSVRKLFESFSRTTMILVIRNPQEYLYSDYLQRLKENLFPGSFNNFIEERYKNFNLSYSINRIKRLEKIFSTDLSLIPYHKEFLFERVLNLLDIPVSELKNIEIPRSNERLPVGTLEFKRVTNRIATYEVSQAINHFLIKFEKSFKLQSSTIGLSQEIIPEYKEMIFREIDVYNEIMGTNHRYFESEFDPSIQERNKMAIYEVMSRQAKSRLKKCADPRQIDEHIVELIRFIYHDSLAAAEN